MGTVLPGMMLHAVGLFVCSVYNAGFVCCVLYKNNFLVQFLLQSTLYGHIKTAEQRTIIQQYSDWYTGC